MIIYSSLLLIAVISGPVCVNAVELKKADHPIDGKFIVTTAPGVITEGGGETGSPQADKILQIIAGPDGELSPTAVALKIQADSNSKKILNSRSGTSNRMLVVGGSGKKQFTSRLEVQGQVRIYCQDPENYDATEYGPMQYWDVSQVTSMYSVFDMYYNGQTNECDIPDISGWDVSQVTNFSWMFESATSFNQNIGNWDVSKGTDFRWMFESATSFNQYIGNWDVSKSTEFSSMFREATSFNQYIGNWDVSKSISFYGMFRYATSFNQYIGNWDVSKVENFRWMFRGATSFNQYIGNWDVSKGTDFDRMFESATSFNQNIGNWDVSKGTEFSYMFYNAPNFKQNLNIWLKWVTKVSHSNWCYGAVCDAPLQSAVPSIAPTKAPSVTPPMMPSVAPTGNENKCVGKSMRECKKLKDVCIFGKNKHCIKRPKKDKKKVCKSTKIRNSCKGCQLKTTCG